MDNLKWRKDTHGNIFDIRERNSTFVIRKKKEGSMGRARFLDVYLYGLRLSIPFNRISSAKKVAQLIHNS